MFEALPSVTAEIVAGFRAGEAARSAPIVEDPHARAFLGPIGRAAAWSPGRLTLGLPTYVVARHRAIDDAIAMHPEAAQVVILGAGYDSRAWRLRAALPKATWFEVDHPATAARKARIAAEHPEWGEGARAVTVDFARQDLRARLRELGFQPNLPTVFVWEGVTMYLPEAAVRATLAHLAELSDAGSALILDFWQRPRGRGALIHHGVSHALTLLGEPVRFGVLPDEVAPLLAHAGFTLRTLLDGADLSARYAADRGPLYPHVLVAHAERARPR